MHAIADKSTLLGADDFAPNMAKLGAKAAGVVSLARAGLPIPPFFCLTSVAFDEIVREFPTGLRGELDHLPADRAELDRIARQAHECVRKVGLTSALRGQIAAAFDETFSPGTRVAVRSSASGEDSARDSFAGQFETFLFVSREQVPDCIVKCLASSFSSRVLMYRRLRSLPLTATRMGVLVQEMVDSSVSGVVFTADPTTSDSDRIVIAAAIGLGEGVVAGTVPADTFVVHAPTETICERMVANKATRVVFDRSAGCGTRIAGTPQELIDAPALPDDTVLAVAELAGRVANLKGRPQDLEWALSTSGTLALLQSRDITTIDTPTAHETIFDRANVIEAYPDVTLPLTFSLVRLAYELSLREAAHTLGAPRVMVQRRATIYETLVGLVQGRLYLNVTSWLDLYRQLPGLDRAIPGWERGLGLANSGATSPVAGSRWPLRWVPLQVVLGIRLLWTWARLSRATDDFGVRVDRQAALVRETLEEESDPHALVGLISGLSQELFRRMAFTAINALLVQQLYELTGKLVRRWALGNETEIRNKLLVSSDGVDSLQPLESLEALTEAIRANPSALRMFEARLASSEIWKRLTEDPELAEIYQRIETHLKRYGDRTTEELKLETVPLAEEPARVVDMIGAALDRSARVGGMMAGEARRATEHAVRSRLRRHPWRRPIFFWVVASCRRRLQARETLRLIRGRLFGLFRVLYLRLGEHLVAGGLLRDRRDVMYLTVDEVAAAVRGQSVTQDLQGLVELRRREYDYLREKPMPVRLATHGVVLASCAHQTQTSDFSDSKGFVLTGVPCSPGRVTANARVLISPSTTEEIDGEILVTVATDPAWVFLMAAASGLVSETGSLLSHAAIIGRELGVPTVVGVSDVVRAVKDGATVALDGAAGTVRVLDTPRAAATPEPS